MRYHENCVRDRRTRIYLSVKRILLSDGVEHAEALLENSEYQTIIHNPPVMTVFPPGSSFVLDFGESLHGGIRFNNYASPGKIQIKFGESVSEAIGISNQDSSRKDAALELSNCGMLEYGNTVFRFVKIKNIGECPIRCLNIMAVALECDFEVTGSFECSDERLNRIWNVSIRTVHLCMQDYIYDGAKRDRIVWMGDMHPEVRGILCAFSDVSIVRESFEFLMRQSPPNAPMNNIYTYSCWFIISVWDYYMATGDRDFLEKHADYFQIMLEMFAGFHSSDGSECIPERRFLDWPNENNLPAKHAGIQALLLWMMQAGEKILLELGMDASSLATTQNILKKHVPDPVGRKAPAALMTLVGLADRRDVLENAPFRDVSTFYGYYMLMAKETRSALELIRRYWGAMLDFGAVSFWEDFDLDWTMNASRIDEPPIAGKKDLHADFGAYCYKGLRHSLSHGWSCGPAPFLSERILGIRFLEAGGRKFTVQPELGDLEYVRGTVPTPYGVIRMEADACGTINITAPRGTEVVNHPTIKN